METAGEKVKQLRLKAGMSQRALAARVNVSFPHISKFEAGLEPASPELLKRIADVLDTDADELILLTDRLPETLREAIVEKPELASRFLRRWKDGRITDDEVRRLIGDDAGGA
jgi:transcriptional regulator with XRE-family HTH domain